MTSSSTGKEEPKCDDNHVREDCDAQCHKIGTHAIVKQNRLQLAKVSNNKESTMENSDTHGQHPECSQGSWNWLWEIMGQQCGPLMIRMARSRGKSEEKDRQRNISKMRR